MSAQAESVTDLLKPGLKTILALMVRRLDRPMTLEDFENFAGMLEAQAKNIREALDA